MNFQEIIAKRNVGTKLNENEVQYLMDDLGKFTNRELGQILKTGKHDGLREMARDELIARITLVPKWIWMCSVAAVLLTIAVYSIQLIDRFSNCIPHPPASSASTGNPADTKEDVPRVSH